MRTSQKIFFVSLWIAFITILTPQVIASETRYVSSLSAKLLENPQFKANTIKKLNKGDQLIIANKNGTWLQVKTVDKTSGWISKFLTKSTPPTNRATVLTGEKNNQLKNVHRRTSAITTAAAARGLASRASASTKDVKSNLKAVKYMESFKISNKELNQFAIPVRGEEK